MGDNIAGKHLSLSTSDDESDFLNKIINRNNTGENKTDSSVNNNVFTREELEERSKLSRAKKTDGEPRHIKSTDAGGKSKSTVSSSRGILKNRSRRDYSASFRMKSFAENITSLERPAEVVPEGMKTNLEIDSWSVASFDTCCADVKRTYAKQFSLRIGRWFATGKSLAVFKNKQGTNFTVPPHEESDWEDEDPYGPHDPDSSFYKRKRKERRSYKRKSKIRRIKSLASFSKRSGPERSRSGGVKKPSRIARLSEKFSRESKNHSESATATVRNKIKGQAEPDIYVPPDMTYDPTFNNGKGGLVNKEPEFLPPNKTWSKAANGGKGGIINKPPQPHTIGPGQIWSRSACNGQGGLVNLKPEVIPEGKMWDYNAENGMGALVEASSSYLMRVKEKAKSKKRKTQRRPRKTKSQGRIRISDTRELLRELNAENDKIFAEIDAEEERQRLRQEMQEKKKNEKKEREIAEESVPPKYVPKADDGSVLIIEEPEVKTSRMSASKDTKAKNNSESESGPTGRTSGKVNRRNSVSARRKSIISAAKSVISKGVQEITRKSIQLKKSVLLASAEKPENKEKAKDFGIEEGLVGKMFETFEAMSLRTDDAVRASDSESSSSGSELL